MNPPFDKIHQRCQGHCKRHSPYSGKLVLGVKGKQCALHFQSEMGTDLTPCRLNHLHIVGEVKTMFLSTRKPQQWNTGFCRPCSPPSERMVSPSALGHGSRWRHPASCCIVLSASPSHFFLKLLHWKLLSNYPLGHGCSTVFWHLPWSESVHFFLFSHLIRLPNFL